MDNQLSLYNAIPAGAIFGTRTSERWSQEPGNIDTINAKVIWPHAGKWGIPTLDPTDFEPSMLAAWHDPGGRDEAAETGGALHFFLDDYRFERVWQKPDKTFDRLEYVGAAITPEFSLWETLPTAAQVWQVYRSRWMGAFWQFNGIEVIPCVIWGSENTWDFAFEGLPENGTLALGTLGPGSNRQEAIQVFVDGLEQLLKLASPKLLLTYGPLPKECEWLNLPRLHQYPTFADKMLARIKNKQPQQQEGTLKWVEAEDTAQLALLDGPLVEPEPCSEASVRETA